MALREASQQEYSVVYEYAGAIILRDGAYLYSYTPYTDKSENSVHTVPENFIMPGDKLVATYHTHPCYPHTYFGQYFSTADVMVSIYSQVPIFVAWLCTGDVHEFQWGVDKVRDTGSDVIVELPSGLLKEVHLPAGRLVGNTGVSTSSQDH